MERHYSIQKKMLIIGLLPILILSFLIVSFGMILLYRSYSVGVQEELKSTTNILVDCLDLTIPGIIIIWMTLCIKGIWISRLLQ